MLNKDKKETRYVLPSICDFDDLFTRTPNTLVFNEVMLDKTPEEVIDILCDISSDRSDSVASCECGTTTGNYYTGMKCRVCGTVVSNNLFGEIRNDSWLEIPASIKGVLNPQVYRILSKWFGNTSYQPILKQMLNMQLLQEPIPGTPFFSGMGFNWFYDNFDAIISYFLVSHPTEPGRAMAPMMKLFLEKTGKAIWCTKLPILSKLIQPITRVSKTVRYADTDIKNLIKSIFTLRSILLAEKMMNFSADHVDRNFYRVYGEFITYTTNILTYKLPKKPSILRKHVFGARSHCSCRSVAIPITDPHDSDEIYLPWKLGVMVYKYHILSVLINKLNMTVFNAFDRIMNAINIYDHEIDCIMQDMIRDCPYKGFPILLNRNPSLRIGSIQLMFVTKIKPGLKKNPFPALVDETPTFISLDPEKRDEESGYDIFGEIPNDRRETNDRRAIRSEYDRRSANGDVDCIKLAEQIVSYIEDGTIEISPMVVKGPNLDLTSF